MSLFPAVLRPSPSSPLSFTRRWLPALGLALLGTLAQAQGFTQCKNLFPTAQPPRVAAAPAQPTRELCYDAFATLYSGRSRTPLFTVEKLTREQLLDARDEERTNRFFADARLPRAERSTLEDYKGSGFDRGHMQYPPSSILGYSFASEGALSRSTQPAYSVATARVWA